MEYVAIEYFNGEIALATDSKGQVIVWSDLEGARDEAKYLQNGIVVPLEPQLMDIVEEAAGSIGVALFELGEFEKESGMEDEDTIEDRLEHLLG